MKIAFRVISYLEGISYLVLLFVGVPMKYIGNDPSLVKAVGMPHGILFMLYVIMAIYARSTFKWDGKTFMLVLLASIIPAGTFYIDRKYC